MARLEAGDPELCPPAVVWVQSKDSMEWAAQMEQSFAAWRTGAPSRSAACARSSGRPHNSGTRISHAGVAGRFLRATEFLTCGSGGTADALGLGPCARGKGGGGSNPLFRTIRLGPAAPRPRSWQAESTIGRVECPERAKRVDGLPQPTVSPQGPSRLVPVLVSRVAAYFSRLTLLARLVPSRSNVTGVPGCKSSNCHPNTMPSRAKGCSVPSSPRISPRWCACSIFVTVPFT